jgi:hypothetical protein
MTRRRWVYTSGGEPLPEPVEVTEDFQATADRMPLFTDRYMEGVVSPVDGSDIGSRTKRREHMKAHGLVDADDYKGEWAKRAERRERFMKTGDDGRDWAGRFEETHQRMSSRRK